MSVRAADLMRPAMSAAFDLFAGDVTYRRGGVPPVVIKAAVRDFKGDTLFGSAMQSDRLATVRARDIVAAGLAKPQRYDQLDATEGTFVVIDWRAHPAVGEPMFFKLAIRGGTK